MPLSYSQVQKDEAKVAISMYGETLNIVYLPSKMTDDIFLKFASFESMKTANDAKEGIKNINEMLSEIIKSWDFYEDDEQTVMWPLNPESLARIDMAFKVKCLFGIMGHVRPEAELPQILT